jgi:hypothetical protein
MGIGGALAAPSTDFLYDRNLLPIGQQLWLRELESCQKFPPPQAARWRIQGWPAPRFGAPTQRPQTSAAAQSGFSASALKGGRGAGMGSRHSRDFSEF